MTNPENPGSNISSAIEQVFAIGELEAQLDDSFIAMSPDEREAFTREMATEMKGEPLNSPNASAVTFLLGRISLADNQDKTVERGRHHLRLVFFDEIERQR